jgi:serine/threonine protein kinase
MLLSIGDIIKGVYRVDEIKHGGMGDVYVCSVLTGGGYALTQRDGADAATRRGEPSTSDAKVALKSVATDFYASAGNREQFEREALICTTLAPHPYIVTSQLVDRLGSAPVIILDYASGGNLRERLAGGRFSVEEMLRVCRQVCVALQYLAECGILHRDLKPENVLFNEADNAQLSDFGLSSLSDYAIGIATGEIDVPAGIEPIRERFIGGTLPYMSPEHFGAGEFTSASDIYSLGAIMFELLEGRLLFDLESVSQYREAHLHRRPPVVSRELAPPDLRDAIARCVEKDPARRFSSVEQLHDALVEVAARGRLSVPEPLSPSRAELERGIPAVGWMQRGYAYGILDRLEKSLQCYRRALELDPDNIGGYNNVAAALSRLGRYDEALEFNEKEVEVHPDVPITRATLGAAYASRGRLDEAARQLEQATRGDPTNVRFIRQLGGVYRRLGREADFSAQVARIVSAMASDPLTYRGPGWVNEGLQFGLMSEFEASLGFLDRAVALYPEFVDAWHNRAVTLLCLSRRDEALDSVGRALKLNPGGPQALFLHGLLCLVDGRNDEGLGEWDMLISSRPTHLYAQFAVRLRLAVGLMPGNEFLGLIGQTMSVPNDLYYRE